MRDVLQSQAGAALCGGGGQSVERLAATICGRNSRSDQLLLVLYVVGGYMVQSRYATGEASGGRAKK